ncbi:MAG TPA: proton-conducting transporter membrane subunit [Thermomicrobiales bacterium]|jgi:multicomponent Na+:H+ antiporter subunit D
MLLLPLLIAWTTAVILALLDGRRRWVGWLAIGAMTTVFAATLRLLLDVLQHGSREIVAGGWPPGLGITLRADELGIVFALVSNGVLLIALIYEVLEGVHERAMPALVLFLATGLTGLFLTGDAFNFYVFFEVSMTTSFVLATYGQRQREIRAALIFTVVNLLGSVFFLSAIASLYHLTGTLDMRALTAAAGTLEQNSITLTAAFLFVAFGVKLGLFPFHFWLPPVYRDTWPAVAAILSGAVANIGSYGLLRFGAEILSRELRLSAGVLVALGTISILYGALQAISVRTANEALAYSAIGQAGYILVALGIGGPVGIGAAILYALINPLNKTLLFLATGLRGWLVGAAFAIGAFSVAGIPPSLGFFGKAALFQVGIADNSAALVGLFFLGGALSLIYMFQIYQRVHWITEKQEQSSSVQSRVLVMGVAVLILALGLWPEPLLLASQRATDMLIGGR